MRPKNAKVTRHTEISVWQISSSCHVLRAYFGMQACDGEWCNIGIVDMAVGQRRMYQGQACQLELEEEGTIGEGASFLAVVEFGVHAC